MASGVPGVLITAARRTQAGTNLIELMIGSLLGLVILSALVTFYSDITGQTRSALKQARFSHDMQAALYLMARDLRRAGYAGLQPGIVPANATPFSDPENTPRTGAYRNEQANSCITFSYDANSDGLLGVGSAKIRHSSDSNRNQERFGYRLRKGKVEMRSGGKTLDCNSGRWQSITGPEISVTRLVFMLVEACLSETHTGKPCEDTAGSLLNRKVAIELKGYLETSPEISVALGETVQLRNHLVRRHNASDANKTR